MAEGYEVLKSYNLPLGLPAIAEALIFYSSRRMIYDPYDDSALEADNGRELRSAGAQDARNRVRAAVRPLLSATHPHRLCSTL